MEMSECSPVPFSLSDIQLPEDPGCPLKPNDVQNEGRNKSDSLSNELVDRCSPSNNKNKANGETAYDLNSSKEEVSVFDTKDSSHSNDSPEKMKNVREKIHSNESSDTESDRHSSPYKKKSFEHQEASSNVATDSNADHPKAALNKEQKYVKAQHTDESDNEKSSDSEKYNRHVESKRKSHNKRRKRDRHSRSSSSSSSHSSDSSPQRRHSKKSHITKKKDFIQNDENNKVSDKSSDEKSVKYKKGHSTAESHKVSNVPKKRLKIKRDNVSIERSSPSVEATTSRKSSERNSSSHLASEKVSKKEPIKTKEIKVEIPSKPVKVTLNRKLNRKSSEENSIESKSKKYKWECFASSRKSSYTVSISTHSLKNWFPDFKLMTETSSSIEMEQDEHSLSTVDEKHNDLPHTDVYNENECSMKQESTSQIDMEDSESQEPNVEDTTDLRLVSKIIFIQNLVRPFTLNQLKDLLKQNGKIVEEYFWIDKIKSKCFVMYETEKEAIKARNALNNTRWPSSNPKILSVEFSSVEELEQHKKGNEPPLPKPPESPVIEPPEILEARISHPVEEHKRKDKERRKEKERTKLHAPVREWDKDKIIQDSPERERAPKEEKSRSSEKKEKKESKKRATEDTPAKLLDDLFQKTKNPPCIYWLPLTEEQAKAKEEAKKVRRLEREKRNQQLKEQEEADRRSKTARSSRRSREKENRKSSTRSRSPVSRRR